MTAAAEWSLRCTTVVQSLYNHLVPNQAQSRPSRRGNPVRQSVTVPDALALQVRRVAKKRGLTMSRALVALAERGVRAEIDAQKNLRAAYRRFLKELEPARKDEVGRELIRAIFGADAIAEDSVL